MLRTPQKKRNRGCPGNHARILQNLISKRKLGNSYRQYFHLTQSAMYRIRFEISKSVPAVRQYEKRSDFQKHPEVDL